MDLLFGSPLDVLEVCDNARCWEKNWTWNVQGNILERLTRITRTGGDVQPNVVSVRISWATLLYYLSKWLWDWAGGFVGRCKQDYVYSLVTLPNKHFNNPLVKYRFPYQRSKFITPMNTLLMLGYCVGESVS